jgi:adenylate cyclase
MSTAAAIQNISDWLMKQGLSEGDYGELLSEFCERLNAAGIHVERSMMAMRILHPTIDARGFIWRRGEDMDNFTTDRGPTDAFL